MANFNKNLKLLIMGTVILLEVSAITAFATKVKAAELNAPKQTLELPVKVENGSIKPVESSSTTPQTQRYTTDSGDTTSSIGLGLYYSNNMEYQGQMPIKIRLSGISQDKINNTNFKVVVKKDGTVLQELIEGDKLQKHIENTDVWLLAYFNSNSDGQYTIEIYDNTNSTSPILLRSHTISLQSGPSIYDKNFSASEEKINLSLDYINPSVVPIDKLSVELQDSLGKVVAKTSNNFNEDYEKLRYETINYDDFFGTDISRHALDATLYKVCEMQPGNYKVVLKNDGQIVDLGKELTINYTDAPLIQHVYIEQPKPVTADQSSVRIQIDGYNINKDQFQVNLKDNLGNIISTAKNGDYRWYDNQNSEIAILYKLDIPQSTPLQNDQKYFVEVVHDTNVVSNTDHVDMYVESRPIAYNIEVLNHFEGVVFIKTSNLPEGTACNVALKEQDAAGTIKSYTEQGVVDKDGNIIIQFKDNGKNVDMSKTYNIIDVFNQADNQLIGEIRGQMNIKDTAAGYNSNTNMVKIPLNTRQFNDDISLNLGYPGQNIADFGLGGDSVEAKLVEQGNESNVVGKFDLSSSNIGPDWIAGTVNITGTLENNKNYIYILYAGGKVYKFENSKIVTATDSPSAIGLTIYPGVYEGNNSASIIDPNTKLLHVNLNGIINVTAVDKVNISLVDSQGRTVAGFDGNVSGGGGDIYSYLSGDLNLTENLPAGDYFLVAKCNGIELCRSKVEVSDKPMIGYYGANNTLQDSETKLLIYASQPLNIDPQKLKLNIVDANGIAVANDLNIDSVQSLISNGYGQLEFNLSSPLHEGYYSYSLMEDNIPIEAVYDYGMRSILVRKAKSEVTDSYIWYDQNVKENTLKISGNNLDSLSTYKVIFYSTANNPYDTDMKFIKSIDNLSNNSNGDSIIISNSQLYGLKQGSYRIFVEQNGKVIGETYLYLGYDITSPSDATLKSLMIDGKLIEGFDPSKLEYTVTIYNAYKYKQVDAVLSNSSANMNISEPSSLPGIATIVVTSEDGTTTNTYKVNFVVGSVTYGDVDDDGTVSNEDASILKQSILGAAKIDSDKALEAADVDRDGRITSTDYALMKRKLNGRIQSLPVESPIPGTLSSGTDGAAIGNNTNDISLTGGTNDQTLSINSISTTENISVQDTSTIDVTEKNIDGSDTLSSISSDNSSNTVISEGIGEAK